MMPAKLTMRKVEWILIGVGFLGLWWVLFYFGAGPVGSDELLYINIGLNPFSDPYILNRYTHVYLEQLFLLLFPNPLTGVRAFEATVIGITCLLVYLNARRLTSDSSFLNGLIALGIFFSANYWGQLIGVPYIDFTVMLLLMIFVSVYLSSAARNHQNPYLIVALGFIFLLGFKTKESFLSAGILLLGLGIGEGGRYKFPLLGKNLLRFGAGLFIGVIVFIILNALILKNPLFGFRPSDFANLQNIFMGATTYNTDPGNWYKTYLFEDILVPVMLFLIAGVFLRGKLPLSILLAWAVPLSLIVLLTLTMIRSTWGVEPRYFIPAWAIVCTFAAHFVDFSLHKDRKDWLIFGLSLLVGMIILVLARFIIIRLTIRWNWLMSDFLETIVSPILFSLLLVFLVLNLRHPISNAIVLVCLMGLIAYPLAYNGIQILNKDAQRSVEARFYPLIAFEAELQPDDEMHMFVSEGVLPVLMVQEDNELFMLVNTCFGSDTTKENYTIGSADSWLSDSLDLSSYDYILLTTPEYFLFADVLQLPDGFQVISDSQHLYTLIWAEE